MEFAKNVYFYTKDLEDKFQNECIRLQVHLKNK